MGKITWPIEPAKSPIGDPKASIYVTAIGRCTLRVEGEDAEEGRPACWEYVMDLVELGGQWWHAEEVLTQEVIAMVCDQEKADDIQRADEDRAEAYGRARNERMGIAA